MLKMHVIPAFKTCCKWHKYEILSSAVIQSIEKEPVMLAGGGHNGEDQAMKDMKQESYIFLFFFLYFLKSPFLCPGHVNLALYNLPEH
ncbi:hypothetical protein GDO81_012130 [Engystomops pustulosus]|uniref:Uncharacterized protein n=1 Tax=Engystomops pustulosus TaxID=76066 RepID=A0AAV7BJN5_ENGPU|nr:hypothetical protein GDO81_012130 [Engystomops pustulosus]